MNFNVRDFPSYADAEAAAQAAGPGLHTVTTDYPGTPGPNGCGPWKSVSKVYNPHPHAVPARHQEVYAQVLAGERVLLADASRAAHELELAGRPECASRVRELTGLDEIDAREAAAVPPPGEFWALDRLC